MAGGDYKAYIDPSGLPARKSIPTEDQFDDGPIIYKE
jgi:hypothetical protein